MQIILKERLSLIILISFLIHLNAFSQEGSRQKISINELWNFSKADTTLSCAWSNVNLPHTWNAKDVVDEEPGYYRGVGWYKRKIKIPANEKKSKTFIYFEGVNNITELYVNKIFAGKHIGGYTAFCFDISKLISVCL